MIGSHRRRRDRNPMNPLRARPALPFTQRSLSGSDRRPGPRCSLRRDPEVGSPHVSTHPRNPVGAACRPALAHGERAVDVTRGAATPRTQRAAPPTAGSSASPSLRALTESSRSLWTAGRRLERASYLIGAVLIVSGVAHLGVYALAGGPWEGPVSWRKAVTFGVAFGLTVIAFVALSSFLVASPRIRRLVVGIFVAACVLEVVLVTAQAWRQVPSHFNRETGFDSAISSVLAAGGAAIVATSMAMTVLALRRRPAAPPSGVLAIRAGTIIFLVALAIGVAMIAKGVALERTVSAAAAYTGGGSLKPAHAVPMQAIIVLPVIAWLLAFHRCSERSRHRLVALATAGYALVTGAVIIESFASVDPLAPTVALGAASAVGLATVIGVGLTPLAGALRPI